MRRRGACCGRSAFDPTQIAGLSAWYPFTADANDYSGNGRNGTASGGVTFGASGAAFNGSTGKVLLPTSIASTSGSVYARITCNAFASPFSGWVTSAPGANPYYNGLFIGGGFDGTWTDESVGFNFFRSVPAGSVNYAVAREVGGEGKYGDGLPHGVCIKVSPDGTIAIDVDSADKTITQPVKTANSFLVSGAELTAFAVGARRVYSGSTPVEQYYAVTVKHLCVFSSILTAEDCAKLNAM